MPCGCQNKKTDKTCAECFIDAARKYLGVQWRHQGRSKEGIDCVGLLICAAKDAGILVDDVRDYRTQPDGERFATLLHQHCNRIDKTSIQAGDLLAIKYTSAPQHLGIVTKVVKNGFHLIHSLGTKQMPGKVIEQRIDAAWYVTHRAKLFAVFRLKVFGTGDGNSLTNGA